MMNRRLSLLLCALVLSGAANAEDKVLAVGGKWRSYSATSTQSKLPMCGMSVGEVPTERSFHIKVQEHSTNLYFLAVKNSWRIPLNTPMRVEIGFDNEGAIVSGHGRGAPGEGFGGSVVDLFSKIAIHEFMASFYRASRIWIRFPDGNEPTWFFDMAGSRSVTGKFMTCVLDLKGMGLSCPKCTNPKWPKEPTQPNTAPPTQPHVDPRTPFKPGSPQWVPSPKSTSPAPPIKRVPTRPYKLTPRGYEQQQDFEDI